MLKLHMVVIVMGVSGSGKTTVGKALAQKMSVPFFDADDFHPSDNVAKMKSGQPLNDEDRKPWLEAMAGKIAEWKKGVGAVLACSALKRSYRGILDADGSAFWVHLRGDKELILERMKARTGHYMPPALLDSQFAALEEPEGVLVLDIRHSPEELVQTIFADKKLQEK